MASKFTKQSHIGFQIDLPYSQSPNGSQINSKLEPFHWLITEWLPNDSNLEPPFHWLITKWTLNWFQLSKLYSLPYPITNWISNWFQVGSSSLSNHKMDPKLIPSYSLFPSQSQTGFQIDSKLEPSQSQNWTQIDSKSFHWTIPKWFPKWFLWVHDFIVSGDPETGMLKGSFLSGMEIKKT